MQQSFTFPRHGEAERWLPVVGWEGLYEVSNLGRVRSLDRVASGCGRGHGRRSGKILKPWLTTTYGYEMVGLYQPGYHERRPVHQLVVEAFIGACPAGQQVRHGPNGKSDNRASQLCYGTPAENQSDRLRDGTSNRGERQGIAKLTDAIVAECRRRHAAGETQVSLALEFGVSKSVMHHAIWGITWTHVPEPIPVKRERAAKAPGPGKGWRSSQTHCGNGHEFTPENTYVPPLTKAKPNPRRNCKICRADQRAKSARKMRGLAA
jgi:hypothetical protein